MVRAYGTRKKKGASKSQQCAEGIQMGNSGVLNEAVPMALGWVM